MSFSIKNDKRDNHQTSQHIITNTLDAYEISTKKLNISEFPLVFNNSTVIINVSQGIDFNSSTFIINNGGQTTINSSTIVINTDNYITLNSSTLIINSQTDACINASGQFKVAADTILLESTGTTTINTSNIISGNSSGDLVLEGPIVSGILSFSASPELVLPTDVHYTYRKIGNVLKFRISAHTGASGPGPLTSYTTTSFIPSELLPLTPNVNYSVPVITSNGVISSGILRVSVAGTIILGVTETPFTTNDTVGFNGIEIDWFVA